MSNHPLTRREFLKTSAVTASVAALACSGVSCSSAPQPDKPAIETPTFTYGTENSVNKPILITYATRTGSTVGVASAIGESLAARGFAVEVKPIQENPPPDGYQAVLIGSAVNGGQWLPEAVQYVKEHQAALKNIPVGLFCVHIMNLGDDAQSRKKRLAYLDSVRPLLGTPQEAFFAGMGMNPAESSGFVRWFYRTFKIGPEGDCRDWDQIRAWGQTVELISTHP